jgi:uncharacterized membrane protein YeaQ/YmgE (transglycosylase-associated protein family)
VTAIGTSPGEGPACCWPPSSGSVGALIGGFIAKAVFGVQTLNTFFNLSTWVTAIVGAVVLFLLFGAVRGHGRRSRRA